MSNKLIPKFDYTSIEDQGLGKLWGNSNIASANDTGRAIADLNSNQYEQALKGFNDSLINTYEADKNVFSNTGIKDAFNEGIGTGPNSNSSGGLFGLSPDTVSGLGSLFNIGKGLFDISNSKKQLGFARDAWNAENKRAEEYLQMKKDDIKEFKTDKARLNQGYANG